MTLSCLKLNLKKEIKMNELITKYLCGESTQEENAQLHAWVISNDENKLEFESTCQAWYISAQLRQEKEFNTEKAFRLFLQKTKAKTETKPKTKVISLWQKVSSAAAVVALMLGAFFLFNQQNQVELLAVTNTQNTISEVTLPDGSSVFLRKNATVKYPSTFEDDKRNIEACGHFFCDVVPNQDAPFTVSTEKVDITVLGTSFDVNCCENNAEVIVSTGKVKVSTDKESVTLVKGECAKFINNALNKSNNTDLNFLSWQTGTLSFEESYLKQVFEDLERHYDVRFDVKDKDILEKQITGTYSNYSIEEMITILSLAFTDVKFDKNKNIYTVSK